MTERRAWRILNLGGGVQSSWLYLAAMRGILPPYDFAVTSDTQDEAGNVERFQGLPDPEESFYSHMDWLGTQAAYLDSRSPLIRNSNCLGAGCPILVRTRGQISEDLLREKNSTGQRFAAIPAFTAALEGGAEGQTKRQCTKEYKVEVIDQTIRRDILGLAAGKRLPAGMFVHQFIGISWEERSRAFDIARRFEIQDTEEVTQLGIFGDDTVISEHTGRRMRANWRVHFEMIEDGRMIARQDCERDLAEWVPHRVFGSSCVQCPYKDDATWQRHMLPGPLRDRLIHIDSGIRKPGAIVNRGLDQKLYLHRTCRPIEQVQFVNERQAGFLMECEGGCGL